jgi:hypothetical protein
VSLVDVSLEHVDSQELTRALTANEPEELRKYLVVPDPSRPLFPGTAVHALGGRSFGQVAGSELLVPRDARADGPMDYAGSYLTLSEYFDYPVAPGAESPTPELLVSAAAAAQDPRTMLVATVLLGRLGADTEKLAKLTEEFKMFLKPELGARFDQAMADEGKRLFSRQPILATLKYLLTHDLEDHRNTALPLVSATILCHAIADTLGSDPESGEQLMPDRPASLVMEMVRSAKLGEGDDMYSAIDRTVRLWRDYGDRIKRHPLRRSPIELLREATGIDLEDIIGLGFGLIAAAQSWEPGGDPWASPTMGLGIDADTIERFVQFVTADPAQLRDALGKSASPYGFLALEQNPVLRDEPGLLVLDEAFLWNRVTSGLYWVVHDHEKSLGEELRHRWTQAFAEMIEYMARDQLRVMSPPVLGSAGGTTFFTEDELAAAYGRRKRCDAAIYFGSHFLAAEIVSGQLSVETRIEGRTSQFRADTERLVIKKCRQLDEASQSVLEGERKLTGFPPTPGLRILPMLVVGGGYPVNPLTIEYVGHILAEEKLLQDPRMESLAIVDLGELEVLEGLSERGHAITDVLIKWQKSSIATLPLRNFLLREFGAGPDVRPTRMKPRVDATFQEIIRRLKIPKETG